MNKEEQFAFSVVCRKHRCNTLLQLISCLCLQKSYEEKEFRIDEVGGRGIGIAFIMVCKTCNKRYDITDYGRW